MKKAISCVLALMFIVCAFSGCQKLSGSREVKITVKSSEWTGWVDAATPEETEKSYTVKSGDVIQLGGVFELEATVVKITKNSIEIKTNHPMSAGESGIDVMTEETKFTIPRDARLRLVTPTVDSGDIFVFTYSELAN